MFSHHLKSLSNESLANQIFQVQKNNNWPGLVNEVKQLCRELELPDITEPHNKISKYNWKFEVGMACRIKDENDLKDMMKSLSKMEGMKDDIFELKNYFKEMTLQQARMQFKLRTHMTICRMNFSNDMENRQSLWKCNSCETNIDTQSHIFFCPAYKTLREGKSLDNDTDVVNYFIEVMRIREKLNLTR